MATAMPQSKATSKRYEPSDNRTIMKDGVPHVRVSAGFHRRLITRGPNKGQSTVEQLYRLVPIIQTPIS